MRYKQGSTTTTKQVCILCCLPYKADFGNHNGKGKGKSLKSVIKEQLAISRFYKEISSFSFSNGGGGEGEGGSKNVPRRTATATKSKSSSADDNQDPFGVCPECLELVKSATDLGSEVEEMELKVRALQTRILLEMKGLQLKVKQFYGKLKKIERIVKESEKAKRFVGGDDDDCGGAAGEIVRLRKGISDVVQSLASYNDHVLSGHLIDSSLTESFQDEHADSDDQEEDNHMDMETTVSMPSTPTPLPLDEEMNVELDDSTNFENVEENSNHNNQNTTSFSSSNIDIPSPSPSFVDQEEEEQEPIDVDALLGKGASEWKKELIKNVIKYGGKRKMRRLKFDPRFKYKMIYNKETDSLSIRDVTDLAINSEEQSLSCSKCSFKVTWDPKRPKVSRTTWPLETELFMHVLIDHLDLLFCSLCNKGRKKPRKHSTWPRFRAHLKMHENPEAYTCPICFKLFTNLAEHKETHKKLTKDGEVSSGKSTNIDFKSMSDFRRRLVLKVISNGGQFITNKKSVKIENDPRLKYSMKYDAKTGLLSIEDIIIEINDEERSATCSRCGYKKFEKESDQKTMAPNILFDHVLGHHLSAYVCPACKKQYAKFEHFTAHLKSHGEINLSCNYCGIFCEDLLALKAHYKTHTTKAKGGVRIHTVSAKTRVACPYCEKVYPREYLSRHKTHCKLWGKRHGGSDSEDDENENGDDTDGEMKLKKEVEEDYQDKDEMEASAHSNQDMDDDNGNGNTPANIKHEPDESHSSSSSDDESEGMEDLAWKKELIQNVIKYGGKRKLKQIGPYDPRFKHNLEYNQETDSFSVGSITGLKINSKKKSLLCSKCPFKIRQSEIPSSSPISPSLESRLLVHVIAKHLENGLICHFLCKDSRKKLRKFRTWESYRGHMRSHEDPEGHKCPICNFHCKSRRSRAYHLKTHQKLIDSGIDFRSMSVFRRNVIDQVLNFGGKRCTVNHRVKPTILEEDPRVNYSLEYDNTTGLLKLGDVTGIKINDKEKSISCPRCDFQAKRKIVEGKRIVKDFCLAESIIFDHILGYHLGAYVCPHCEEVQKCGFQDFELHVTTEHIGMEVEETPKKKIKK